MKKSVLGLSLIIFIVLFFIACTNEQPEVAEYRVLVSLVGQGTVGPSQGTFKAGTMITLEVRPAQGWQFSNWSGQNFQDLIKAGDNWRLLIDSDKYLTANFKEIEDGDEDHEKYWDLIVDIEGNGLIMPRQGSFLDGTLVNLDVSPSPAWSFSHWAGMNGHEVFRSGNEWTILMNSPKKIKAIFAAQEETKYSLTINIIGQGDVEEKTIFDDYPESTKVRLWAKAAPGWIFQEWLGDLKSDEEILFIEMDKDKELTAVFREKNYNLKISVLGEGSVEEKLISVDYPQASIVKLTALAAPGWDFVEWRGDARGNKSELILEINEDMEITAVFLEKKTNLTITIIGQGEVEEELISGSYEPGALVRLKAIPARDWEFKEWQGAGRGREPVIELLMDEDKEINAVFIEKKGYSLRVITRGQGRVEENLITASSQSSYPEGSLVKLKAIASSGWFFKEWRGDGQGTASEFELVMDCDKEVEAIFLEETSGGMAELTGKISLTHLWPNPYQNREGALGVSKETTGKLPLLSYARLRNTPLAQATCEPGELIVGFQKGLLLACEELSILEEMALDVIMPISSLSAYLVRVPEVTDLFSAREAAVRLEDKLGSLKASIAYVEPNYCVSILSNQKSCKIPNDPLFAQQWHYKQIRLPQAWSVTTGSKSVRIALLDTGVAVAHPDLGDNVDLVSGWNFVEHNDNTTDYQQHGSHCAGIIAANSNNSVGVTGIMWQASIIPVKVLSDTGTGSVARVAKGIMYAAGLDEQPIPQAAQVISMSLGGTAESDVLKDACDAAAKEGILVLSSSGNGNGPVGYPAAYDSVFCIGATNYNYPHAPERARYSSYGPEMDFVVPGGDINVDTDKDGHVDGVLSTTFPRRQPWAYDYLYLNGTSMACPHAAGIIGLMLANGIPQSRVREVLHRTAIDLGEPGFDNEFGHGLANAYWAVNDVQEIKIIVGRRQGNILEEVASGSVDLKSQSYTLSNIPTGSYKVFGFIDVQRTNTIDSGDYLFESEEIVFRSNERLTLDIDLKEVQ